MHPVPPTATGDAAAPAPRSGPIPSALSSAPLPERGEFSVTFRGERDFEALDAAEAWLTARGFSVGAMQRGAPIAVMHGEVAIAKWRNLDPEERADLHGLIKTPSLSFREGPVTVVVNRFAPASVLAAFNLSDDDLIDRDAQEAVEART